MREEQRRGWRRQRGGAGGAGRGAPGCAGLPPAVRGLRVSEGGRSRALLCPSDTFPTSCTPLCMKFQWRKMDFLRYLLFFSAVAVSRAQVQQDPSAETSEGTDINITCSHPNIQSNEYIQWYRQLPGRGPAFLVSAVKGFKEVQHPAGRLSLSADRRSSALWLARPGLGDAAVYYCALVARGAKPGLRPCANRFGRGGGTVPIGPAGGAACSAAKFHPVQGAPP